MTLAQEVLSKINEASNVIDRCPDLSEDQKKYWKTVDDKLAKECSYAISAIGKGKIDIVNKYAMPYFEKLISISVPLSEKDEYKVSWKSIGATDAGQTLIFVDVLANAAKACDILNGTREDHPEMWQFG